MTKVETQKIAKFFYQIFAKVTISSQPLCQIRAQRPPPVAYKAPLPSALRKALRLIRIPAIEALAINELLATFWPFGLCRYRLGAAFDQLAGRLILQHEQSKAAHLLPV